MDLSTAAPRPAQARPVRFAALRVPAYRRYFSANLLSMTADNIEHVISYWVMFQLFHSPALAGFAVISHWVPFLLFSMHAGALADRHDCRKLIQISQGLFMLASLTWGLLFLAGTLEVWHAVVILLIHGAAGVVGAPASQLLIHDMVRHEDLPSAIRLNASSRYLAILLGPAVGGGLMLLLGPAGGLLTNVLLFLPFSIFIRRVPFTGHADGTERAASSGFLELVGVFIRTRSDPRIATMIILAGASSFFVGNAFQAQMPEYAEMLGANDTGARYTILLAANAAGAVIGTLMLEGATWMRPNARTAIVCAALWGATMALFALTDNYTAAVALLVAAGIFSIAFTSMAQTLVQVLAPARIRGTVVGLFNTAMLGLRAGSGITVGVLGTFIGVRQSLELSSAMVVAVSLVLLARSARDGKTESVTLEPNSHPG
ncbi:MAG: MFS transporter [Acidobacteria bacterium]|nr:MFS transporter [Acidobacteriota bacterium]